MGNISSTLDRIKDTTIMRMIRNMAGIVNEQQDSIDKMGEKVDDAVDLVNELDKEVDKATSDISQLKISDAEHTEQIAHLDTVVDNHATEITALKAKDATIDTEISSLKTKDTQHDTEIQGLSESVVTDLVATFDNSSRKLSLSIEREQAESIDAVVTIPAGGGGSGGSYSAGDGIAISDANVISVDDTVGKKSEIVALQNATKPAIKAIEVTETAEKVSITTTALDDATKITEDIGVVSDTKAGIVTPGLKKKWDSNVSVSMIDTIGIPITHIAYEKASAFSSAKHYQIANATVVNLFSWATRLITPLFTSIINLNSPSVLDTQMTKVTITLTSDVISDLTNVANYVKNQLLNFNITKFRFILAFRQSENIIINANISERALGVLVDNNNITFHDIYFSKSLEENSKVNAFLFSPTQPLIATIIELYND